MLDDFKKYVLEEFSINIEYKESDTPDTFESIFGTSFINESNN